MSKEAKELAKQLLAIADDLQDEWDGGDHADIFDQITARYIDRISSLIDAAFAKVREECTNGVCGNCKDLNGEYDGLSLPCTDCWIKATILGTESKP